MNKNNITAIVLMILVVFGFSYWSSHNNKPKTESPRYRKHSADRFGDSNHRFARSADRQQRDFSPRHAPRVRT